MPKPASNSEDRPFGPVVDRPFRPGAHVAGVRFFWPEWRSAREKFLQLATSRIHDPIRAALAPTFEQVLRRQGRDIVAYWDVLTFLQSSASRKVFDSDDRLYLTCLHLLAELDEGRLRDDTIADLVVMREFDLIRERIKWHSGDHELAQTPALARVDPALYEAGTDRPSRVKPCWVRTFEIEAEPLVGPLEDVDWRRLLTLATLTHLRADMVIFLETGLQRIRRCERAACRMWFCARPMASALQRFCCNSCRASSARESRRAAPPRKRGVN